MFNRYTIYRKAGRLWCYAALLFAPAMVSAQDGLLLASARQVDRTVTQRTESISLRDALDEVQNHFHVSFVYESTVVEGKEIAGKISMKGKVENTLSRLLDPMGLRFKKINERTYSIFPKAPVKTSRDGKSAHGEADISALLYTSASNEIVDAIAAIPVDISV